MNSSRPSVAGNETPAADAFTERVRKGDKALYRARFAGFDEEAAEAACKQIRLSDMGCVALRK
jgi:D-alanyl-D-alanine carboxypeptidase